MHRDKEVTLVIRSLGGGGAEKVCLNLANQFVNHGVGVKVLVLHLKNSVYDTQLDPKIMLVNLNTYHARNSLYKLFRYISKNKPKRLLVFNHQLAVALVVVCSFMRDKPKIIARNINTLSEKAKNENSFWHKYVVSYLVKILYNKVDFIIAQSFGMKADLVKNYGISEDKIAVINNPISAEYESVPSIKSGDEQRYILCVGRLEKAKCFHFAIDSLARVKERFPDLKLMIVGQGSLRNWLEEYARNLRLEDSVVFKGFQSDLNYIYQNAELTILTSAYEGFPNVLVESIALGTPVVSVDCPSGPKEIIIDGLNGYLVCNRNIEEFSSKVIEALTRKWDFEKIKASAAKYSSSSISKKYLNVIC